MLRPCGWRHKSKQLHMSCIVWDCIKFTVSDYNNKSSQNRHAISIMDKASWASTTSIADLIREQPVQTTIKWVKAHQDNDSNRILTSEAAMNVKADDLATSFLKITKQRRTAGPLQTQPTFRPCMQV